MARRPQPRPQQQHTGGTPGPRQFIILDNMPKMNTRPMRQNLSEKEAYWIENLQPIAGNDLKIVPAPIFPLTILPGKTVARQFSTALLVNPADPNSQLIDYVIFFATDGSATAVRADNGTSIQFAPPGTFSTTPDMTTFSDSMVLIADPLAGYCTWDGLTFTPAINGIPCTTVAVFGGRAWLAHRRVLTWSGTTGPTDFSTANASGSTTITDADLVHEITALRSLNNYLYIFGDQSVKFIGNVTVANPPAGTVGVSTTEFSIVTLASDIGCPFPMSILSYNRLVMFANMHGVYAIVGASVQTVSEDLDGIWMRVDFSQELCAALADINEIHCYLLLLRYQDPSNFQVFGMQPQGQPITRSIIAVFQTRDWYVLNQGMSLISIVSLPIAETNVLEVFGSSGSDLTPLLVDDNSPVTYILKTPLTAHGNIILNKRAIRAGIALSASQPQSLTFLIESENQTNEYTLTAARPIIWRNASDDIITWTNNETPPVEFQFMLGPGFSVPYRSVESYGHVLGATVFATSSSMSINAVLFEYIDADLWSELPGLPPQHGGSLRG